MEALKSDLKKVVLASTELISRAGSLQVPSWRFPEKLATSLDIGGVLEEGAKDKVADQNFILELIIDRLLLLLQCCVHNLQGGQESTPIPFTLGSTIKKVSKCMIQNSARLSDLKKKISSKTEKISSLESSISDLHRENILLQDRLKTYSLAYSLENKGDKHAMKLSLSPNVAVPSRKIVSVSTQTTDTAFALCARCSATQTTLVSAASLVTELCHRHKLKSHFSSCDWNALAKVGGIELKKWLESFQIDMKSLEMDKYLLEDVTSERDQLVENECLLKSEVEKLQTHIETLEMTVQENRKSSEIALARSNNKLQIVQSNSHEMYSKNHHIRRELKSSQMEITHLAAVVTELENSRSAIEEELSRVKSHELELEKSKKKLEEQFESLVMQSQEVLDDKQIELNKSKLNNQTLEKKLESIKVKQSALLHQLEELDEESVSLRDELNQVKKNRDQLLDDLQEANSRCTQLQDDLSIEQGRLSESNQEYAVLNSELSTLQSLLLDTKEQLNTEKRNCRLLMDFPFVEQTGLDYKDSIANLIQNQQLRQQITANTVRILLLEEQNNELRYKTMRGAEKLKKKGNVHSKMSKVGQPLLLWESGLVSKLQHEQESSKEAAQKIQYSDQIADLEYEPSPSSQFNTETQSTPTITAYSEQIPVVNSRSPVHSKVKKIPTNEVSGVSSKLKGRLGHLVCAINEAHNASSRPLHGKSKKHHLLKESHAAHDQKSKDKDKNTEEMNDLPVVHLCANCDEMCYDRDELTTS